MEMVRTKDLIFEYTIQGDENSLDQKHMALDKVNIEIKKGEFIAVLGHNGSGKSTLAKHMNSLLLPTSGTVWVRGYDTSVEENTWEIRQNAGMVFQNPDNQIIATIVEEDVAFGPENLGVESSEIRNRVDQALNVVGMTDYKDYAPHYLSGGQKQRIAIAGILAMKPECIILDEPTAMLDPNGRREVIETITRLNKQDGITIILITHYMEEAIQADRVIVMEKGQVVMNDTPKKIFRQVDKLKDLGLDVPQVTEIAYNLKKQGIDIKDDILTISELVVELCRYKSKS